MDIFGESEERPDIDRSRAANEEPKEIFKQSSLTDSPPKFDQPLPSMVRFDSAPPNKPNNKQ